MNNRRDFPNKFYGKATNPNVPKPLDKEHAVTEVLTHEEPKRYRPIPEKPLIAHRKPHFNELYGGLGTEGGWRNVVDNYAVGNVTTVAGTPVSVAVNLALKQNWKVDQWPGAVNLYLVIRKFSIALQSATLATLGGVDVLFQDTGGQIIPLGDMISNSSMSTDQATVIPTPLADPGNSNVGTLLVTLNAGATVGVYFWQMAFAGAYLIPALKGYELELPAEEFHHEKYLHQPVHR